MIRASRGGIAFIVLAALAVPATAQAGFFDQLFGGGSQSSGSFFGFPAQGTSGEEGPVRHRKAHPRKIVDDKPVLQTPTDLMHDRTLRYGDAVMTKTGINIFVGEGGGVHDAEDFTSLKNVRTMKPKEKLALAEINAARTGQILESDRHLITGRSSADVRTISEGVMITDRDGKSIRYVGP